MNIGKRLFPNINKLIVKDETITAQIIDAELDPVDCIFQNDGCVELNIKGYEYLTLSRENLEQLINLIDASEAKYEQILKNK